MIPAPEDDRELLKRMLGAMLIACSVLIIIALVAFTLSGCSPLGTTTKKIATPPAPPTRTAENVENAQKIAALLTDGTKKADEMGLVPKSTESGTLVKLAVTNEAFTGSPATRVDLANEKAINALIGTMQRQEEQFRHDRAAWEAKIDALSRQNDQYKTEVTTMGGVIAKLKFWLTLGLIALALACVFIPGLWLFVVKFVIGRAKAQFVTTVQGIQEFREANRDIAPKLDGFLKAHQDNDTQNAVIDIKAKMKKKRAA